MSSSALKSIHGLAAALVPAPAPAISHPDRELLRVVVVGSVDDGKSSLIGRLLYECDGLFEDQIASVQKKSVDGEIDFSLFTDGLKAEREQGITIDVAYRYLTTHNRQVIIADTPGHVQYTRNMATGASTADAVVVLVDARLGVQPQTRRHAFIASLLGIPHLAIAINKIDLVEDPRAVFERLAAEVGAMTKALRFAEVRAFPVSAKRGDNVTMPSARTPWFTGGTLLDWLEALPHGAGREGAAMRLPVQLVVRPDLDYRGFAGSLASGRISVGDEIEVLPSRLPSRVKAIDTFDGSVDAAVAPAAITVRLEHEVDISRGDVIAHVGTGPEIFDDTHALGVDVVWFADAPLRPGVKYLVKQLTRQVQAIAEAVEFEIELDGLTHVPSLELGKNGLGRIRLRPLRPLVADAYAQDRTTGALILIDLLTNATVGAGMIVGPASAIAATTIAPPTVAAATATATAAPTAMPLDATRTARLVQLVRGLDAGALHWISGYTAGLATERSGTATTAPTPVATTHAATILYGSHTGHGRAIAEQLHASLIASGIAARVRSTTGYTLRDLAAARRLYIVMSTHGDGDPPDDARSFVDALVSRRAPKLPALQYAVLALGDSSYPKFCETGRIVDERLAALGATQLQPRVDCDVDYAQPATAWRTAIEREAVANANANANVRALSAAPVAAPSTASHTIPATLTTAANQRLTLGLATKDVRHVELTFPPGALVYEPGDSIAIVHDNPADIVTAILAALGASADLPIAHDNHERPLGTWLTRHLEITRTTRALLAAHAALGDAEVGAIVADRSRVGRFVETHQVIDLLRRQPNAWTPHALVAALRPLAPRSYSIASSLKRHPDEVHLTVAVVDYLAHGARHRGAASGYLADLRDGDDVRGYIEANPRFRLPASDDTDILMIGPGTGVAPFRAFLEERVERGARGRHWLVFGEHHRRWQFLYQAEWLDAKRAGQLHELDVAFSRDQGHKIYVQHRLLERGRDVFAWLAAGGHVYVCGDAKAMAPDVEAALLEISVRHGGLDAEGASAWLDGLRTDGRYQRDVY